KPQVTPEPPILPKVVNPIKPTVKDPLRPPDVPARPTAPARATAPAKVPPQEPVEFDQPPMPFAKPQPAPVAPASSASDAHLGGVSPFVAFGSVAVTLVFVGLLFVRKNKGETKAKPLASVPASNKNSEPRKEVPRKAEQPGATAPTVELFEPGAIRAAD